MTFLVIDCLKPYLLILIPIALVLIWFTTKKLTRMYKLRRNIILVLRSLVLIFLILALVGVNITWNAKTTTTVFLMDASDSTLASRAQEEKFVTDAISKKPASDKTGVVAFGNNALIENFVAKDNIFSKIETKPNSSYTNIENGLLSALSLIPKNSKKRIVLVTDGEENEGKASKIAPSLIDQGVDLKICKVEKNVGSEVALDNISVPQKLSVGEEFNVVVNISSTVNTSAKLSLFSGKDKTAEEKVQLNKGNNRFVFRDVSEVGGFKTYKAIIEPDIDTEVKNNEASTFVNIKDRPKVLVIEDTKGEADEVVKMVQASGMDFNKINATSAPTSLQELTQYKSIITCNVSAEKLNNGFLNALDSYVKDFGGGFIATGGENSYALGGYYKTNLEKVLPVNMEMKGKKEIPDMCIELVIDKSGSMMEGNGGIMKLDIAKEGAVRSLESLRANDEIGVLTFDDTIYWVVDRKKAADKEAIKKDIGTIRPGGGTSILPALEEAYESTKKSSAKIKHIILLTDGQAENEGYDDLIKKINKDNITVSTVAVGGDADTELLSHIAKAANGRYYYSNDITNIPTIFAKETFMAARTYLNNRQFTPVISSSHPILQGVAEGGLPSLLGYIGASPKDTARVLLKSDEDDPILTVWQYGLGRTVAWNSDINGKWSSNYIGWDKNIKLWQNMINFTAQDYENENAAMDVSIDGSKGVITFKDKNNKEEIDTRASIIAPNMESNEIKLYPTAPGQYSGTFDVKEPGVYMVKGRQLNGEETLSAISSGLAVQYSAEYKLNQTSSTLDALINETGGTYINSPEEVFTGKLKDISAKLDLTPLFLVLAIILFMLDIAVRRLNIPFEKVNLFFGFVKRKVEKLIKIKLPQNKYKRRPAYESMISVDDTTDKGEIKAKEKLEKKVVAEQKQPEIKQKNLEKTKEDTLDTSALLKRKDKKYR